MRGRYKAYTFIVNHSIPCPNLVLASFTWRELKPSIFEAMGCPYDSSEGQPIHVGNWNGSLRQHIDVGLYTIILKAGRSIQIQFSAHKTCILAAELVWSRLKWLDSAGNFIMLCELGAQRRVQMVQRMKWPYAIPRKEDKITQKRRTWQNKI